MTAKTSSSWLFVDRTRPRHINPGLVLLQQSTSEKRLSLDLFCTKFGSHNFKDEGVTVGDEPSASSRLKSPGFLVLRSYPYHR